MKPLEGLNGSVEHDLSAGRERDGGVSWRGQDRACPWAGLAGATGCPLCYRYKSKVKSLLSTAIPTTHLAKSSSALARQVKDFA